MLAVTSFAQSEKQFFLRLAELGYAPTTVFDIGGSNAAWSTTICEVYPEARYELFEPLAGLRDDYDQVLDSALRDHTNFRLHKFALGETNGMAEFWSEPAGVGSSLLVAHVPKEQRIQVPVRRLDDYVAEHGLSQPDVIKVDVQGGELQVINGGLKTFANASVLHLESWLRRGYGRATPLLHELMDALRPLDFFLVDLGDYYRKPDEELVSVDAFFAHRRLIEELRSRGNGFPWPPNWTP